LINLLAYDALQIVGVRGRRSAVVP